MKKYSLKTVIALRFAVIVLTAIALISIASNILISRQFEKYVSEQQKNEAKEIAMNLAWQFHRSSSEWNLEYIHGLGMYALNEGYILKLYDIEHHILWDAENHDMTRCSQMMDSISERMQEKYPRMDGDFVSHKFNLEQNNEVIGFLDISYYSPYYLNENEFQFIEALNKILFSLGSSSLLGAVIAGVILANKLAKSINRTVEITKQISGGNYNVHCYEDINL